MSHSVPSTALPTDSPIDSAADSELSLFTAALVKGDDAAWSDFHERYRLRLLAYLSRTWQGESASLDDLLQETLLRAVRHMRIFREEEVLWSWLTVLARSSVTDHGRRRTRWWNFLRRWRLEADLRALPSNPERFADQLEDALRKLDHDTRTLLEEKYYQRLSVRDLSTRYDATEKAIEGRLARARQQLTKILTRSRSDS